MTGDEIRTLDTHTHYSTNEKVIINHSLKWNPSAWFSNAKKKTEKKKKKILLDR